MDALRGQKRDKAIVVPRQIAMFLMREETDVSLLRIGAELGGRDHSTVLHACDKINREIAGQRRAAPRDRRRPGADLRRVTPPGRPGRLAGSARRAGPSRRRVDKRPDPVDNRAAMWTTAPVPVGRTDRGAVADRRRPAGACARWSSTARPRWPSTGTTPAVVHGPGRSSTAGAATRPHGRAVHTVHGTDDDDDGVRR